nr:MAG TPA: hypothetical protein [Caudoviricetes sp.]
MPTFLRITPLNSTWEFTCFDPLSDPLNFLLLPP